MGSKTFLDVFEEFISPLEKAQLAIGRDDDVELRRILQMNPMGSRSQITEETYTNPELKDNLLHYTVYQNAGLCASLLVSPELGWNPDRENAIGYSALKLCEENFYLPVWYALSSASSTPTPTFGLYRPFGALLICPTTYKWRPFSVEELFGIPVYFQVSQASASTREQATLTGYSLVLTLELLSTNPELASPELASSLAGGQHQSELAHVGAGPCFDFPLCLSKVISSPEARLGDLLSAWLWHRYAGHARNPPGATFRSAIRSEATALSNRPHCLLEQCRRQIRRHIVHRMWEDPSISARYPQYLKCLNLPKNLYEFISYTKFWPMLSERKMSRFHRFT